MCRPKGPFIATQLNSTRLDSTDLLRADWLYAATGSVAISDRRRQLSCIGEGVYSDATQLN